MGFPPHHWFPPKRNPKPRSAPRVRGFTYEPYDPAGEDFHDWQSYVRLRSVDGFSNPLFHSVCNRGSVRGNWSMVAVTTNGHCGSIPISLGISHGQVYSTGGGFAGHPVQLVGRISASGQVRMNAVAGPRSAHGTGRFNQFREGNSAMPKGKKT
jgi:hypothetical protein